MHVNCNASQQLDENDVDEEFENLREQIDDINAELRQLHLRLDDAKETRRNRILFKLSNAHGLKDDVHFVETFDLYKVWSAGRGEVSQMLSRGLFL